MASLLILLCVLQGQIVDYNTAPELSPGIKEKLESQGFVIVPTMNRNIYDIYEFAKKRGEPIIVTSDLVLHTSHILFDYTLRVLELETLLPKVEELTRGMIEANWNQMRMQIHYRSANIPDAIMSNLIFFGVAGKLLGIELPKGIPEQIIKEIDKEVRLIESHKSPTNSPIFGYQEDYTQYIPRGHYTRNADFERYFQAMMWYGRMGFYLKPHPSMYCPKEIDPIEEGIKLTRRAILITKTLKSSPKLAKLWKEIYKPTTFFAGKSDDLTIEDYKKLLNKNNLYGQDKSVQVFIERAKKLPPPRIVSTLTEDTLGLLGFRFMGQRFIPDSYIFQNLIYPKVLGYSGEGHPFTLVKTPIGDLRCFPRGLDVMSVFGSSAAGDILKQEGDTEYNKYDKQIRKLKSEFRKFPESQWQENLYWRWLWALKKLATHPHTGYPKFMQSRLWALKELNAALGSWAELRHDTILYGKQSYMLVTSSAPRPIELTEGWVEPYPEIYKWMSDFVKELAKTSEYPQEISKNLLKYAEILQSLSIISSKELKDKPLTEMEHRLIWNIGSTLKGVTQFSPDLMRKITSGADEEMAVIADVHTDPNSKKVLEEGVGYPSIIYVKLPGKVVKGGVFSYYEFKAPMDERYTDEKWQEELRTNPPKPQKWFLPLLNK